MILHTIVPREIVMRQDTPPPHTEYLHETCGLVEVSRVSGEMRVGRLISTDPKAYLDSRFQPGERLPGSCGRKTERPF